MMSSMSCEKGQLFGLIMIKKNIVFIGFLSALIFLFCGAASADAASPWKWIFSLKNSSKDAQVILPTGVYVDETKQRYYVADAGSGSLHSYDKQGKYLNTFKPGNTLDQPFSTVRDADDVLWVVEKGRNSLTRIDLKEKKVEPHFLQINGRDVFPDRMMLFEGSFYILDKFSGDIVAYNNSLKNIGTFSCDDCSGGFIDFTVKDGNVWGLARTENAVFQYTTKGKLLGKVQLGDDLAFPYAIEIGAAGLLYVLDRHEGAIVVYDQKGVFKYRFLSKGSERGKLYYPEDLLFDPWGRLCVVDSGNGRVEVFGR